MPKGRCLILLIWLSLLFSDNVEESERVDFKSANPFSFYHIVTELEEQEEQDAYGILRMPEQHNSALPVPLVMGVNGSKNWANHHLEYMQMFREIGFATFELQSFNSRNVKSTVGEQISVTTAMMILDAYRALDALASDSRIDIGKVAITGWSLGGGVALFSAWGPLIKAISPSIDFSAHLSFYPPCLVDMELMQFSSSPIHILIGELDDWVTADACNNLVSDLKKENVNIDITIYEQAYDSFDKKGPIKKESNGYSTVDHFFKMRSDAALLVNIFDIPMITPIKQKVSLA